MAELTILSTGHNVADARLHRITAAVLATGVTVEIRAHGDPGDAPRGAAFRGRRDRPSRARRFARALIAAASSRSPVVMVIDPDLIVPTWAWARLRRQRFVVDVHEDYEAVSRDRPWVRGPVGPAARIAVRLAMRAASRADLTVVADDHLPPHHARRRLVARHVPEVGDHARTPRRDSSPRAVYIGDVRPSRGLWSMLEAINAAPGWTLDVVGSISEVPREEVDRRVRAKKLSDRIVFHGQLPPDRAWTIAQGAWCGLALLDETPAYRAAIPSKIHEYLAAGLPVLATPLPRVDRLLRNVEAGRTTASPEGAGAILREWGENRATVDAMARSGVLWAETRGSEENSLEQLAEHLFAMAGRARD